ncbi:hypothetical protein OAN61_00740 [bacterium]|nr:hypothetical protein [bacterium]
MVSCSDVSAHAQVAVSVAHTDGAGGVGGGGGGGGGGGDRLAAGEHVDRQQ